MACRGGRDRPVWESFRGAKISGTVPVRELFCFEGLRKDKGGMAAFCTLVRGSRGSSSRLFLRAFTTLRTKRNMELRSYEFITILPVIKTFVKGHESHAVLGQGIQLFTARVWEPSHESCVPGFRRKCQQKANCFSC